LKDVFIEITSSIKAMKICRIEKIYPNETGIPFKPSVTFNFSVYLQVVLNRILELSESIIICMGDSNLASSFILLRALDENASTLFDANLRLAKLIEENDFQQVYELITNLQYGTRLPDILKKHIEKQVNTESDTYYTEEKIKEIYTSQQILTVMDRVSKTLPDHRETYEYLCEYAHPNYDGLMGLYCEWKDKLTVNISKVNNLNEENIKKIFFSFRLFLTMFVDSYDSILKSLPAITKLAIDDLKSKGEDTTSYENPI